MSYLRVVKYVATGNDFLFIDARSVLQPPFSNIARSDIVRRICDRHFGLGADGAVFVENASNSASVAGKFRWDFYNTDGSHAEMCGNASRCFGLWAYHEAGMAAAELETLSGIVRTQADGSGLVTSHLDYVDVKFEDATVEIMNEKRHVVFVNTGVPHAVIEIDEIESARTCKEEIRVLRHHPLSGKRGANVTFLQISPNASQSFATISFERGVEGFTLSCGTGVLAAAAVGLRNSQSKKALLKTPGGELEVVFGPDWRGASLRGPAQVVFETRITEGFFKGVS